MGGWSPAFEFDLSGPTKVRPILRALCGTISRNDLSDSFKVIGGVRGPTDAHQGRNHFSMLNYNVMIEQISTVGGGDSFLHGFHETRLVLQSLTDRSLHHVFGSFAATCSHFLKTHFFFGSEVDFHAESLPWFNLYAIQQVPT